TGQEIIDEARQHLASYQKPRSVEFVAELPKAPTGKILKRELRAPYWEGHDRGVWHGPGGGAAGPGAYPRRPAVPRRDVHGRTVAGVAAGRHGPGRTRRHVRAPAGGVDGRGGRLGNDLGRVLRLVWHQRRGRP